MFKKITNVMLRGTLAFVPLFLTIYFLIASIRWLNDVSVKALALVSPNLSPFPGAGILLALFLIFVLGLIVTSRFTRWLFRLAETPLRTLPLVKDVYGALNQLAELFQPKDRHGPGAVVRVSHPDIDASMIGLVMRRDFGDLPAGMHKEGTVAVYLPMGYQIGGFTVFVPEAWVEELDMAVETALGHTLTGWAEKPHDV